MYQARDNGAVNSNKYLLTRIFETYDKDKSCDISAQEFEQLIFDLIFLRDGQQSPSLAEPTLRQIATTIAACFPIAERVRGISLDQFIAAASVSPANYNPFNHPLTGPQGLLSTLLQNFEPSYEYRVLPPWETIGYGLTQKCIPQSKHERKFPTSVKIDFPLRLTIYSPSLQRTFRVDAPSRSTSVGQIILKLLEDLPSHRSSSPNSLQLIYNHAPLDKNLTVETGRLYFIACERRDVTFEPNYVGAFMDQPQPTVPLSTTAPAPAPAPTPAPTPSHPSHPPHPPHPSSFTSSREHSQSKTQKFEASLVDFERKHALKVIDCLEACRRELANIFIHEKGLFQVSIADTIQDFDPEDRVHLKEEVHRTQRRLEDQLGSLDEALAILVRQNNVTM